MVFFTGFITGLSLIFAIGAQNLFVLRHGLIGRHVGLVCTICIVSDIVLIAVGVSALGGFVTAYPLWIALIRYAGALLLLADALQKAIACLRPTASRVIGAPHRYTRRRTVFICLTLTWLNPHVYLDTVVLLGSIAAQYHEARWYFGLGAMTASAVFFVLLG